MLQLPTAAELALVRIHVTTQSQYYHWDHDYYGIVADLLASTPTHAYTLPSFLKNTWRIVHQCVTSRCTPASSKAHESSIASSDATTTTTTATETTATTTASSSPSLLTSATTTTSDINGAVVEGSMSREVTIPARFEKEKAQVLCQLHGFIASVERSVANCHAGALFVDMKTCCAMITKYATEHLQNYSTASLTTNDGDDEDGDEDDEDLVIALCMHKVLLDMFFVFGIDDQRVLTDFNALESIGHQAPKPSKRAGILKGEPFKDVLKKKLV
jgi:hypothetical protein